MGKKIIVPLLSAMLVLSLAACGSSSSESSGTTTSETTVEETTEAETEEEIEEEIFDDGGKSGILVVETLENVGSGDELGFELTDDQKDFINGHLNLFPADSEDMDELKEYLDLDLDLAHMKKNPQKYNDTFAYLDNLYVVQAAEESSSSDEYDNFSTFNLMDLDGNPYMIYYVGKSVDAVEGDWVRTIAMPISNSSYGNTEGNTVLTLVMIASVIENVDEPELLTEFVGTVPSGDVSEDEESDLEKEVADAENGEYILPDSDSRYLSADDLDGLTKDELRIARNEIYARHGRIFDSEDLSEYFNSKSWYNGTTPAAQFNDSVLNDYEKKNAELIQSVENGGGSSSSSGFQKIDMYGEYEMYTSSDVNTAEVGFYTADPEGDYINLGNMDIGGSHYYRTYTGLLHSIGENTYITSDEDMGVTMTVTFSAGKMTIKVTEDVYGYNYQVFDGTYDQTYKLDVSKVS